MKKCFKNLFLMSVSIFLMTFSLSNEAFEKKCAVNQNNQEVCVFDSVMLPTDNQRSAVAYSMVIDLFENEEGVLMAKVSRPVVLGPTHAPTKNKIVILPVDSLIIIN